jgi:TRAP-type C4-dicarboxylate transport system permease small subunit
MPKRKREPKAAEEFREARGKLWLWAGMLTAPLAFLVHLSVNYALVTQLCQSTHKLASHLVTVLFVLISAAGGLISWRNWETAGRKWPGEEATVPERSRFMAVVGLLVSALVVLALVWQLVPQFIFDPCQR